VADPGLRHPFEKMGARCLLNDQARRTLMVNI